jgi:hypothetical protein
MQSIGHIEMMDVHAPGRVYHGGSQMWYTGYWQRRAGCGPVNTSNVMWYLARTRPEMKALWAVGDASRASFEKLMAVMYDYVRPGMRGVNTTQMLTDGAGRFARDRGVALKADVLAVSEDKPARPPWEKVASFLLDAFARDLPAVFLNLSNGQVRNLDNWHWVTLVALDPDTMTATMLDQGNKVDIDLGLWLDSTTGGGGFVTLEGA